MAKIMAIYIINVSRNDSNPVPDKQMEQIIQFIKNLAPQIERCNPNQKCQCTHENTAPGNAVFKTIANTIKTKGVTKDKGYWPKSDSCYRFKAMALSYISLADSGTTTQFIVCEKNTALFEHLPKYLAKELNAKLIESNKTRKTQIMQIIYEKNHKANIIHTSFHTPNN